MSKTVHSVKLQPYDSVDLDRLSYSNGDLVYDLTSGTIRLMDGVSQGGRKLATQTYVTSSLAAYATTASLSSYATTASLSSYATTASLSSYITSTSLTTTLNSYATTSSVSALAPILNPVFSGSITTPTAIIGGINIKSFAIAMGASLA
jgi:hypothetical protein